MSNVSNLFKTSVPRKRKIFSEIKSGDTQLSDLTYKKFKKENFELAVFKSYFLNMDRFNYLTNSQISNMFKYLTLNLKYYKYSTVKSIIEDLDDTRDKLAKKLETLTDGLDVGLSNSINKIISSIDEYEDLVASKIGYSNEELHKLFAFDNVVEKILKPKNYNELDSMRLIYENLKLLEFHNIKGKKFPDLLYTAIKYSKTSHNEERFNYYKRLVNSIRNIKALEINRFDILEALDIEPKVLIKSTCLDEKMANMKYDTRNCRYVVDDFLVSIDNDDTKRIDDALSIEKTPLDTYILGIHITDVYSLGIFANEILKCERDKGHVSKLKASLKEMQKKNAISLFVEMSQDGMIINHKLVPTIVKVKKNLLYDDVCEIITKCEDAQVTQTVTNLLRLFYALDNEKFQSYPSISNIARMLVNKYMLLYGCIVSDMFCKIDVGIFLSDNNYYSPEITYYDAGFKEFKTYSKLTKPLYDKPSLIGQYLINECIFQNMSEENKKELKLRLPEVCNSLNKKEKKQFTED